MSKDVFIETLHLVPRFDNLTIGGGEPLMHPMFFELLDMAVEANGKAGHNELMVITNGKEFEATKKLIQLAYEKRIILTVSLDKYHKPLPDYVMAEYLNVDRHPYINMAYSFIPGTLVKAGRAKDLPLAEDVCVDPQVIVDAHGRIWTCGCLRRNIGTVMNPQVPADYVDGICNKDIMPLSKRITRLPAVLCG
jgi:hypothetical protein